MEKLKNLLFKQKRASMKKRKLELVMLYVYFALIIAVALWLNFNHVQLVLAYMAIPALYFTSQIKYSEKIKLETLFFGIFCTVIIDFTGHMSHAWHVPALFGIKILNTIPVEEFVWGFSYLLLILSIYEYFFDHSRSRKINPHFRKIVNITSGIFFAIIIAYIIIPEALVIPYFYALLITVNVLITINGFFKHSEIASKISRTVAYLFVPQIAYELTALKLGHWGFRRGLHIGYVELFGTTFPFEELLWFIFMASSILVIHETFADNQK